MSPDDLVAQRKRFIERQIARRPDILDVSIEGREPSGTGPTNRHGRPAVPPGQRVVTNWPVLDLGVKPQIARDSWRCEVGGAVANPTTLDWVALSALPEVEDTSDFHCVTTWSRLDNLWRGVRFRDLAALVVPHDDARFVLFTGADVLPGSDVAYTTNLPLERALEPDVLLAHHWEGEPIPTEHGGPVRIITPRLYAWKGAKWVVKIEFLTEEQLGFWEVRGYSNTAEPWFEDRYSSRS